MKNPFVSHSRKLGCQAISYNVQKTKDKSFVLRTIQALAARIFVFCLLSLVLRNLSNKTPKATAIAKKARARRAPAAAAARRRARARARVRETHLRKMKYTRGYY